MSKNKFLAVGLLGLVAFSAIYISTPKKKAAPIEEEVEEMTPAEAFETSRRDNSIPSARRQPQPLTVDQAAEQMSGPKPTDAFWIWAMGLYLAQQSRVPASELKPFLEQALRSPQMPANIKTEMASKIGFYFPELRR